MINLHHLMLFYHVARCGGIAAALPQIGYGIQQPALSGQMLLLERELGTVLFQRRPFALTAAGRHLFAYLRDFFEPLRHVLDEVRHAGAPHLRIGADEIVLTEYLPPVLATLCRKFPELPFAIRAGTAEERLAALQAGHLDLAILALHHRPPIDLEVKPLLRAPLALLAPSHTSYRAADLLRPDFPRPPLIVSTDVALEHFAAGLKARKLVWRPHSRVPSLALVPWLVSSLGAVGLTIDLTPPNRRRGLRRLPLPDFPPVEIVAVWRTPTNSLQDALLQALDSECCPIAAVEV